MNEVSAKINFKHILIIAAIAMIAMLPMLMKGLTTGNDFFHHFQIASVIQDSLKTGEIYPSVASDSSFGFGSPVVRFYPPFSYYLLAGLSLVFGNWYYAAFLSFYLIFFLGGLGVYFWAREEFSDQHSLLAAGIFILAPFHLNEIYNNYLYAEFAATAVTPFCLLFITRLCKRKNNADILGLAAGYALLILTHIPTTVVFSIVFVIYSVFLLTKQNAFAIIIRLTASVAIALAASSFFWLRMVSEVNWVNLSVSSFYGGMYDFRNNFLLRPENITKFLDDPLSLWLGELMLASLIVISLPSLFFLVRNRLNSGKFNILLAAIFLFTIFMASQFSSLIWENLSILQKIQFPWRWLTAASLTAAVLAPFGILRITDSLKSKNRKLIALPLVGVLASFLLAGIFITQQAVFIDAEQFNSQMSGIETKELDKFWRTIWTSDDYPKSENRVEFDGRSIEILNWQPRNKLVHVGGGGSQKLRLNIFYYPHWRASRESSEIPIEKTPNGAMEISVNETEQTIIFEFVEPLRVRIANIISAATWFAIFVLIIFSMLKRKHLNSEIEK